MRNLKLISFILCLAVFITGCSKGGAVQKAEGQKEESKAPQVAAEQQTTLDTSKDNKTQPESNTNSNTANGNAGNNAAGANKNNNAGSTNTKNPSPSNEVKSNGKTIVIDPGHANRSNLDKEALAPGSSEMKIKDGGGAAGVVTRTPEYLVNMQVALKLKALLEQKGYKVVMTKTDNSLSLGNVERAEIWNKANPALAIRIHADSSDSSSVKGASMLVPAPINSNTKAIYSESKRCGGVVLNTLVKEVGMQNRGVVERNDMTGFNWSTVPVILVEMGFLSNPDEDRLLSSAAYEDKLAKGLADGIADAVK